MKFQVYAGSFGVACEAYIVALDKQRITETTQRALAPKVRWWHALFLSSYQPRDLSTLSFPSYRKATCLRAIAKHKASNIMLEVTDEEIGDIALYLPDEGKIDRI